MSGANEGTEIPGLVPATDGSKKVAAEAAGEAADKQKRNPQVWTFSQNLFRYVIITIGYDSLCRAVCNGIDRPNTQ